MDIDKDIQLDLDFETIDLSGITMDNGMSGTYLTSTGINSIWSDTLTISSIGETQPRNTVQINGEGADILVNGESVMDTLRGIQERLNILRPNPELEAEWDELREAGERYRELERQFAEKSKMWNTLKQMPPPEIK